MNPFAGSSYSAPMKPLRSIGIALPTLLLIAAGLVAPTWHEVGHAQHDAEHRAEHAAHAHTDGAAFTLGLSAADHVDLACVLCTTISVGNAGLFATAFIAPPAAGPFAGLTTAPPSRFVLVRSIRGPPVA